MHPDERFILMVAGSIETVDSLSAYFDSAKSSMNPHNKNFGFYVYGNLPLNIIRLTADYFDQLPMDLIARRISASFDVLTALLVFVLAWRLFGAWTGLLAFAFYSFSVLPIQLSHFGTFDIHGAFFCTLVLLLAHILQTACSDCKKFNYLKILLLVVLGGGLSAAAAATKINLLAIYGLIPLALLTGLYRFGIPQALLKTIFLSLFGCIFLFLGFRFFQPIAFEGPGFWNFTLNQKWISNIQELLGQSKPSIHFPPAVQWVERTRIHSFLNITKWGFGLPLGLFGLVAWFFCAYKSLRDKQVNLVLLLTWTLVGLILFSFLPLAQAMRYSIVVFPPLAVLSAYLGKLLVYEPQPWLMSYWNKSERYAATGLLAFVILTTGMWAFAFTNIYRQTNSRIAASEWILNNIPAAINFENIDGSLFKISVGAEKDSIVLPNRVVFIPDQPLAARSIVIPKFSLSGDRQVVPLTVSIRSAHGQELFRVQLDAMAGDLKLNFPEILDFEKGEQYYIEIATQSAPGTIAKISKIEFGHETSWDDSLPQRINGWDPYGGIYSGEVNLEIYWTDTEEKAARIAKALSQTDYFYLSSNRQVGSIGRLPKVFPVANLFYQRLLGCSAREYLPACYAQSKVGERFGDLGFELIQIFESYPSLFGVEFNTQLADESFQVYDHPKVLLFRNEKRLSAAELQKKLSPVRIVKSKE